MRQVHNRLALAALVLASLALGAGAAEAPMVESPTWAEIAGDILGDAVPADGAAGLSRAPPA